MTSAVLDVNVIISAIIAPKGSPRQILTAWEAGHLTVQVSEGIIFEIEEKLRNPKIGGKYGITEEDIECIRGLLLTQARVVPSWKSRTSACGSAGPGGPKSNRHPQRPLFSA